MKRIDLIAPTEDYPSVIATDWTSGVGKNFIDAQNWCMPAIELTLTVARAT